MAISYTTTLGAWVEVYQPVDCYWPVGERAKAHFQCEMSITRRADLEKVPLQYQEFRALVRAYLP